MATPENIRFHAAGHIAAAIFLAEHGQAEAAKMILQIVDEYAHAPTVSAPAPLLQMLDDAGRAPETKLVELRLLEEWFCNPMNTLIEQSGARM